MPTVFISYSWDSEMHSARVASLARMLRERGVVAEIDQYEPTGPDEGWLRWMLGRIAEADFVLIVVTPTWVRRAEGREDPGKGLGVAFEGGLLLAELHRAGLASRRIVPVLFEDEPDASVPGWLWSFQRYRLPDRFWELYAHVTGQAAVEKPAIGEIVAVPARTAAPPAGWDAPPPKR